MSTVVDSKVVEMTFDNKQFERETKNTMKTLDQLKKELDFDQSAKSLDKLNKAAQNVDFNGMGKAIDQVSVKLSAMEIIGTTALVNLTNKVVNAGERLVKSMTIDQVTDGWNKYAQKTEAVQTLLNSTGKSLNEINGYLETLQWYSDETSYGFTDMTQALSTMTIAGGKIEKLTPMIMGVANATAFAGKGAREFKSIMYNLSQSYSKGSLQTIDWKSVQLMGGASVQLKEALVQQAIALGKLKKGSTSKNFDQYLTDHVFTTDVMEAAFLQFSDYTEFVKKLVDKFEVSATDLNTEIIPTLVEAKKAGKEKLNEVVVKNNWEKYLPYLSKMEKLYDGLGKKAFLAAQEAKTFKEAIEATKDAVSSQFAQIFEAIFGDYYKAKKLWTDFVNWLYDLLVAPLESLREKIEKIMAYKPVSELRKFADTLKKVGANTDSTAKSLEYYQKMVNKIWRGDYKNQPYRKGLLEKEGHNFKVLQNLVNLGYQHKLTTEEVAAVEKKYGKGIVDNAKNLDKMSDKQLRALGLTEEQVKLYRQLSKEAKTVGLSLNDYISQLADAQEEELLTGRELFIGIFTNIGNAITSILNAIGEAFNKAFGKNSQEAAESAYTVLSALYGITKRISDFFDKDRKRYDKNGKELKNLNNAYTNIVNTLKGFFGILSLIASVMKIGIKIAFGVVSGVLKAFGFTLDNILDVTGAVGEAIFNISKFIEKSVIGAVVNALVDILVSLIDVVVELLTYSNPLFDIINKIKNAIMGFFKGISEYLKGDKAKKTLSDIGKTLGTILSSTVMLLGNVISKTINWITHNKVILSIVNAIRNAFTNAAKAIHDWIKSGEAGNAVAKAFTNLGKAIVWVINTMAKCINATIKWTRNNKTLQKIVKTLGEYLSIVFKTIGKWLSKVDFVGIFTKIGKTIFNIVTKVKNWIVNNTKLVEGLKSVWEWLKKSAEGFATWFSGIKDADNIPKYIIKGLVNGLKSGFTAVFSAIGSLASGILSTFAKILGIHSPSIKFFSFGINIVRGLMDGIENILPVCLNLIKTLGESIINVFKNLDIGTVLATIITVGAVVTITKVAKALENFSKPFAAISGILGQVKNTVIEFNKTLAAFKVELYSQAVKNIATAILILAGAIFILSKIKVEKAWIAVGMIATLLAAIAAVILAIGYMSSKQNVKQFGLFAGTLAALAVLVGAIGTMAIKLAIALKLMDGLQNTTKNMITLFAPIIGLLVIVGIIVALSKKFGANNELFKVSAVFKAVSALMASISKMVLAMAIAMKIVGSIKPERFEIVKEFLRIVLAMIIVVVALVVASTQLKDSDSKKLETLSRVIKSIGTMILTLSVAVILLSKLSAEKWKSGASRLGMLLALVVAFYVLIIVINKIGDKGVKKSSMDALSKMIGSIALLAIVVGILGLMSAKTIRKGLFALAILMLFVAALYGIIAVINHFTAKKGKGDASQAIIKVAMSIVILAAAVIILGLIDTNILKKGMTVVILLGLLVAGLMYCASLIKKGVEKAIFGIAAILAILAISVLVLGNMKTEKLIAGTAALSILIGMLILLFKNLDKLKISKTTAVSIAIIGGIIALLGMVLFAISFLPAKQTIPAALALAALIGVLILAFKQINSIKIGEEMGDKLAYLLTLTIIMIGIAIALRLAGSNSWNESLAAAAGIGLLLSILIVSLSALSKGNGVNLSGSTILKTIIMLAVLVGVAAGLAYTLNLVKDPNGAIQSAAAISILLGVMVASLLVLAKMENLIPKAKNGIIGLAALTVILIGIAFAISLVNNVGNSIETIKQLSIMLIVLTGVLAVLTVIGMAKEAAFYGIAALAALIIAIVGIATLLGSLIKSEKTITKGLDVLVLVSKKIGEAIAAFVGAILDMVTDKMPKIGESLSKFAENIKPFINIMKTVNSKVLTGVGIMAASIIAMCIAELFAAVTKILTLSVSFATVGTELSNFATNSEDFIKIGKNIPDNLAKNMLNLAKAMLAIAAGDFLDKLSQKLFGGGSAIQRFADNLPILGEGLSDFVDKLGTFNDDTVKTVDCASQAIASLAKASGKIPRSGGWIQKLIGEKNIKDFGKSLGELGIGLAKFRSALGNKFTKTDAEVVDNAANAVSSMAQAAEKIPRSGGEWQKKYGGKDLGAFANDIGDTGAGLKVFRDKIKQFTKDDMERVKFGAQMIEQFASSAAHILVSANGFTYDENDKPHLEAIQAFANDLPSFGTGLTELFKELPSSNNIVQYAEKIKNFEVMTKFLGTVNDIIQETNGFEEGSGYVLDLSSVRSEVIGFLNSFGSAIKDFSTKMASVDDTKVDHGFEIITKTISFIEKVIKINILNLSKFNSEMSKMLGGTFIESISTILESLKDDSFKLNKDEQYWKNLSAFSQAVGQTIVENVSKGIDTSLAAYQIYTSIYKLLSSVFDLFTGKINSKDPIKSMVKAANLNALANFGKSVVTAICNGIDSDNSKKTILESLNFVGDYLKDNIKKVKLDNIAVDDFRLTISKLKVTFGDETEELKKKIKENLESEFDNILKSINLGTTMTLTPVINATVSWDQQTEQKFQGLLIANTALSNNVNALKNSFATDLNNQTTRIVNKLDEVNKSVKDIDSSENYTINIDGKVLASNNEINTIVKDLTKALEKHYKTGNTGGA